MYCLSEGVGGGGTGHASTAPMSSPDTATEGLLAGRPGFPKGLRVLLADAEGPAMNDVREQLQQLGYDVTTCPAAAAAALVCRGTGAGGPGADAALGRAPQRPPPPGSPASSQSSCGTSAAGCAAAAAPAAPYDVILADLPAAGGDPAQLAAAAAAAGVPLVLMGAGCAPGDVVRGVRLGAADFLERPLSGLKLRNLWQHTVRRALNARHGGGGAD
ncbi:hypothetical protein MNEG_16363, partial [Monoraphidium neglectum]